MSLKQKLLDALQTYGRLDLNGIDAICRGYPAKQSVAEKRLREFREPRHKNYHPEVQLEYKNGYISAYVWKTASQNASQQEITDKADIPLTILGTNKPYFNF